MRTRILAATVLIPILSLSACGGSQPAQPANVSQSEFDYIMAEITCSDVDSSVGDLDTTLGALARIYASVGTNVTAQPDSDTVSQWRAVLDWWYENKCG